MLDEKVKQDVYVQCLCGNFLPWVDDLTEQENRTFIYQEDGATCLYDKYATWYKQRCCIVGFDFWPVQSPDLNPIEHVWTHLEKRLVKRRTQAKNVEQLKTCLRDEWNKIDVSYLEGLVESMSRRCQAVIDTKGSNTRY